MIDGAEYYRGLGGGGGRCCFPITGDNSFFCRLQSVVRQVCRTLALASRTRYTNLVVLASTVDK